MPNDTTYRKDTTYKVTLKPLERFFLGGETTFGPDNENYFVRSRYFPQQTTILGMMRYLLLMQKNLLKPDGSIRDQNGEGLKPEMLIGPDSFKATPLPKDDIDVPSYGIIQELSPVFISGPDGDYFTQSREYTLQDYEDTVTGATSKEIHPLKVCYCPGVTRYHPLSKSAATLKTNAIPYFEGINAKTIFPDLLVNASTGKMRPYDYTPGTNNILMPGIFIPEEQVGIRRDGKGKIDKNGFYRQIGYHMREGFGYCFYIKMAQEIEREGVKFSITPNPGPIRMGADQSWYSLTIEQVVFDKQEANDKSVIADIITCETQGIFDNCNNPKKKIVLLSDTFLPNEAYRKATFASVSTSDFRNLETTTRSPGDREEGETAAKETFYLEGSNLKLKKSTITRELLKRGSVLFFTTEADKKEVLTAITTQQPYRTIGYNYAI